MAEKKTKYSCGMCKNCTPVHDFNTLSLKGQPTLGTCPHWTTSRCVILSHDYCDIHFELRDELSGMTADVRAKEEEEQKKRQQRQEMLDNYWKEHQEIKETLYHPKDLKKIKKTKKK